MFPSATPEGVIAFTYSAVRLSFCWPLPSTTSESRLLRFKIIRSLLFVNSILLLVPSIYAVYLHRDNLLEFTKIMCLTLGVLHVPAQATFWFARYDEFQKLIEVMKFCCERANSFERHVFQRYVDKYAMLYGASVFWFYLCGFTVIVGTFFISDPFPTGAEYPFRVDYEPLRTIIFAQQTLVGLQCAAQLCTNVLCALLLLFAAARFEILMNDLRDVRDPNSFVKCIKNYYVVKRYAMEVANLARFTTLISLCICGIESVFSGVIIIGRQPFTVKLQYFTVTGLSLLGVFMFAWPADNLIDVSENAMKAVYESKWYEQPVNMQKFVLLAMIPQSPVILRINCIIPAFSLNYYCSFITNILSMFTALRIVLLKDED